MDNIKGLNPGQTHNIGSHNSFTQTQHKGTHVDIVSHMDKGPNAVDSHVVSRVDRNGNIDTTVYGKGERADR